jgi:hypothetical protein
LASCVATVPFEPPQGAEPAAAAKPVQTARIHIGSRGMSNEATWGDTDDHIAIGLSYDAMWHVKPTVDFGAEVGALSSFDSMRVHTVSGKGTSIDDVNTDAATWEFAVGGRASFKIADICWRAYVAAGLSFIYAAIDIEHRNNDNSVTFDESDSSPAFYAHTGILYSFDEHFSAGIDFRILRGSDIALFGTDGDADYDQFTFFAGYSF